MTEQVRQDPAQRGSAQGAGAGGAARKSGPGLSDREALQFALGLTAGPLSAGQLKRVTAVKAQLFQQIRTAALDPKHPLHGEAEAARAFVQRYVGSARQPATGVKANQALGAFRKLGPDGQRWALYLQAETSRDQSAWRRRTQHEPWLLTGETRTQYLARTRPPSDAANLYEPLPEESERSRRMAAERALQVPAWQRKLLQGASDIAGLHLSGLIGGQNVDIQMAARAKADADQAQAKTGIRIPRPGERDFQNALPNLTAAHQFRERYPLRRRAGLPGSQRALEALHPQARRFVTALDARETALHGRTTDPNQGTMQTVGLASDLLMGRIVRGGGAQAERLGQKLVERRVGKEAVREAVSRGFMDSVGKGSKTFLRDTAVRATPQALSGATRFGLQGAYATQAQTGDPKKAVQEGLKMTGHGLGAGMLSRLLAPNLAGTQAAVGRRMLQIPLQGGLENAFVEGMQAAGQGDVAGAPYRMAGAFGTGAVLSAPQAIKEGLRPPGPDSPEVIVYRAAPKTEFGIVTGGAFLNHREKGQAAGIREHLLEAWRQRERYRNAVFNAKTPKKQVDAMVDAQANRYKSPFISTSFDRAGAESARQSLESKGKPAEVIEIRGPRTAGFDFEQQFAELGGSTKPRRVEDAKMQEFGIPDLFIPPRTLRPWDTFWGVPAKEKSRSGFYIVRRK